MNHTINNLEINSPLLSDEDELSEILEIIEPSNLSLHHTHISGKLDKHSVTEITQNTHSQIENITALFDNMKIQMDQGDINSKSSSPTPPLLRVPLLKFQHLQNTPLLLSPSEEESVQILLQSQNPSAKRRIAVKQNEKAKKCILKTLTSFSEASAEIFDKMTEVLDTHRRFKSSDFFEKRDSRPIHILSKLFQRKKYVTGQYTYKGDLPHTILSQDAFVSCFKTYFNKLRAEMLLHDEKDIYLADALTQLDIKHLNSLYFILGRYSTIASHSQHFDKEDMIALNKMLTAVENTLYSLSLGSITKLRGSISREFGLSLQTSYEEVVDNQSNYTSKRKGFLELVKDISTLEKSDVFFAMYIIFISHDQYEPETASFFVDYSQFIEVHENAIQPKKTFLSPRNTYNSSNKNSQLLFESHNHENIQSPLKLVKKTSLQMIQDIKDGKLNIEGSLVKKAAEFLELYSKTPHEFTYSDAKEIIDNAKNELRENCSTRFRYTDIINSPHLDDTIFIMSEPFFRICSEMGIPAFTRKELKLNALVKLIQISPQIALRKLQ